MALLSAFKRILSMLAIIGLIAGSVNAPVMAMAAAEPSMQMADAMPCCPGKTLPDCGKTCPLLVMCLAPVLPACPVASLPIQLDANKLEQAMGDDAPIKGAALFPQRRPPRI